MNVPKPHFLLFSKGERREDRGEWSFVLQAADGTATLEASDSEPELRGERLELLAVVRGLEALDQPSRVTLITPSRYVNRGIAYGLEEWRRNEWTWERYGEMVPVKNRDLWQRLDRAMNLHKIEFRNWRFDPPHEDSSRPAKEAQAESNKTFTGSRPATLRRWAIRFRARWRRWAGEGLESWRLAWSRMGTPWLPMPWLD